MKTIYGKYTITFIAQNIWEYRVLHCFEYKKIGVHSNYSIQQNKFGQLDVSKEGFDHFQKFLLGKYPYNKEDKFNKQEIAAFQLDDFKLAVWLAAK